jgi:hypothetical protein
MRNVVRLSIVFGVAVAVFMAFMAAIAVGSAFAADLPKEGRYDFTGCWSGVSNPITFSNTHSAFTYEFTGTTRSNPPGGFGDKRSFRCIGMGTSFGGRPTNNTVCESVGMDGDSDKILTSFSLASDGKVTRETVAGTGKYEGIVTSGIVEPLGPFPVMKPGTFQDCNHQTGTYKLK